MTDGNLLRLLISEDNPVLSRALGIFFNGQPDIDLVGQAAGSGDTLSLCKVLRPDVILVNSKLYPMNIMTFIGRLCDEFPAIQIVVFASGFDEMLHDAYKQAGASATVNQGIFATDLLTVIQTAHHG
jgi:DNA-binding NarL/FixJ family response regulator